MEEIIKKLGHYLADSYILYFKTLNFHWNMTGPAFFMYHTLFQSQYETLAEANDTIAERIRQLGAKTPGSMKEFLQLAQMKESSTTLSAQEMVQELVGSHRLMVHQSASLITLFEKKGDMGTSDLIIDRLRDHDKQAWLLVSHFNDTQAL